MSFFTPPTAKPQVGPMIIVEHVCVYVQGSLFDQINGINDKHKTKK